MLQNSLLLLLVISSAICYPGDLFESKKFKVGIEYDKSLPMKGGSDRYRHRNNYDPFFVTITATSKNNFVITYLEVTATIDSGGTIDFRVLRGQTGSTTMVFQLISNHSDFLSYSYMTYGIREEEYRKIANVITIPVPTNKEIRLHNPGFKIIITIISVLIIYMS